MKTYSGPYINHHYTQQKNLLARLKLVNVDKQNILNFDYYDIQDGDTPETIAFKYYNNTEYHWTILIANDIIMMILFITLWPFYLYRFTFAALNIYHYE